VIKSELIDRILSQNPHLYRQDAEKVVNAIFSEIAAAMTRRDRVELRGFGVFFVKLRESRTGRNPRTGALVSVESKAVPFFRSGKEMRSLLNPGLKPETGRDTVP
jgi:integration host factor subunit beta